MIAGIGIDIVDIARIEALLNRYGMRFLRRILSAEEISFCAGRHDAASCVAGRFAVKEAAFKALSMGRSSGIAFKDIVVDAAGVTRVPGVPVEGPIDIVGAGDSAMAGLASALCAGATPVEAALVGNLAASVTVRQLGTTGTASRAQMLQAFEASWSDNEAGYRYLAGR